MARDSDEYETEDYRPDDTESDSDDFAKDIPSAVRSRRRTQTSGERSPSLNKTSSISTRPYHPQSKYPNSLPRNISLPRVTMQRAHHDPPAPPRKKRKIEFDHGGNATTASDSDDPILRRRPANRSRLTANTPGVYPGVEEGEDALFKARARCVELLADLHTVRFWMENVHRDIYKDAPAHIREILEQVHI